MEKNKSDAQPTQVSVTISEGSEPCKTRIYAPEPPQQPSCMEQFATNWISIYVYLAIIDLVLYTLNHYQIKRMKIFVLLLCISYGVFKELMSTVSDWVKFVVFVIIICYNIFNLISLVISFVNC